MTPKEMLAHYEKELEYKEKEYLRLEEHMIRLRCAKVAVETLIEQGYIDK